MQAPHGSLPARAPARAAPATAQAHAAARLPPYAAALAAGALARAAAAWCAPGFYARDDYFHVLQPALAYLADPAFDWEHSGLPGAGIRSQLLPRLVWLVLRALRGAGIGVESPELQLRGVYLAIGFLGLAQVPAMDHLARSALGPAPARRAGWAAALYFVFPYAGTRLLIEALAMAPLCGALACLHGRGRRQALCGGLLFGLAIWWRLQVLAALPGLIWGLARRPDTGNRGERGVRWGAAAVGLAAGLGLQGGFDALMGVPAWAPLWRNVVANVHPPAGLSRSGPLGYLGLWVALSLPPLSPWLAYGLAEAARRAPGVMAPWASFVLVHACIPHKEDRFMLPVVPLFVIGLCCAPEGLARAGGRLGAWLQRLWPAARAATLALGAVALGLACTAASQAQLRGLMVALRADPEAHAVIAMGPELQLYYLGGRRLPHAQRAQISERWLDAAQAQLAAAGTPANRFAVFARDRQVIEVLLRLRGLQCAAPQEFSGAWIDRLVYRLNPRRNRRRSPVLLYSCRRISSSTWAAASPAADQAAQRQEKRRRAARTAPDAALNSPQI